MKQFEVEIAEAAERDLEEISDYIAYRLYNASAALKLIREIQKAFDSLKTMPERQALVVDVYLAAKGLRVLPVANYLIFYRVRQEEAKVIVVRILYNRRAWERILN